MRRRELLVAAGTAGWPLPLHAQQKTVPVIGYLTLGNGTRGLFPLAVADLRRGPAEAGYVEGKNLAIEYRFASGRS